MRVPDKVAIVTGAGGRIGSAIARRLATEGATVVLNDVTTERTEPLASAIRDGGGQALAWAADVRHSAAVSEMVEAAIDRYGGIDILVNNAGGSAGLLKRLSLFEHTTEEVWDFVVDLNLKGTLICTRAVLGSMVARGGGKIVNLGSIAGTVGIIERVDYSAAKGGIISLTKALAMEVGPHAINVNCVSPGAISTQPGSMDDGTYLGRTGRPEDVANLVLFLVSDEADYLTGQNIIIDGGRSLGPKTQALDKLPSRKPAEEQP